MTGRSYFYEKPATNEWRVFFSTSYLPSIAMFYDILSAVSEKKYALNTEEVFVKQTFRNRTFILSSQGIQILTVPVIKKTGQKTKDVKIFNSLKWQDNHWKTLKTCYNNSPFFLHYSDEIKKIYERNFVFLLDLNNEFLSFLFDKFDKIKFDKIKLKNTRNLYGQSDENFTQDFAQDFTQDFTLPYITTFESNKHISIKQLSVLDLLFNTGNEATNYLSQCQKQHQKTSN